MKRSVFTVKEKIGYGISSVGDTVVYNLLIFYALFFMTDVVGLNPLMAGNIVFFATLWNAVSVSFIGYISDNFPRRGGKRLPYMKGAIFPMAVTLVMFFSVIGGSDELAGIYYTLVMAALMTTHAFYVVPYEALGADLTMNSDERGALRGYARFFMGIGNLTGIVFILPAVELLQDKGLSETRSWQAVIVTAALLGAFSQIVTCRVFKENHVLERKKAKRQNLLKEYIDILKLKPFLILLAGSVFLSIASVFCNSGIVYFMQYNMTINAYSKSFVLGIMTIVGIVITPVLAKLVKRFDKKSVMGWCYTIAGIGLILFKLMGIHSTTALCAYIIVLTIGTSAYWQIIYAMVYDVSELDEYKNHRKRGAVLLSMSKIILRISNACATQLLAFVLFCFGYDQDTNQQSAEALRGIEYSLTLIPAALFLSAAICMRLYPLSRTAHLEIVKALQRRSN